jgi:D-amino peptidase
MNMGAREMGNPEGAMMKVLIAADMEGVTGVVHWDHVDAKHSEYGRYRRLMTGDVNAAVRGACAAGAEEIVVSDGHGDGRNILIEELDPRARLNSGSPSALSMIQGIDAGIGAAMFIGYHARAGSRNAILDHTWSSSTVTNVWLNGVVFGEIGWNAAVCGHFGVPVILISGDQAACSEASELLGPIETVVVKRAGGRMAAECLAPEAAHKQIEEAAKRAIRQFKLGRSPESWRPTEPVTVAVELVTSEMADRAELFPTVTRLDGRRIEFSAENVLLAYRIFRLLARVVRG